MSWWWPTKPSDDDESAVIRRLDDHLRRINFYEPVEHNLTVFSDALLCENFHKVAPHVHWIGNIIDGQHF